MKEYDREKRKWVEPEEVSGKSLKKRDTCKSKRPHQFVLTIPDYALGSSRNVWDLTEEQIHKYYDFEEEERDFNNKMHEKRVAAGLDRRYSSYPRKRTLHYRCEVCGKLETVYE